MKFKPQSNEINSDLLVNGSYIGTVQTKHAELIVLAVNAHDVLVAALIKARIELGRLHSVHYAQFQGKVGLPDIDVILEVDEALKLADE